MSRLLFFSLLNLSMQVNATEFAGKLTDSLPKRLSKSDYWERSDNQRTVAIVLLSVGGATMIVGGIGYYFVALEGFASLFNTETKYSEKKLQAYGTAFIVGGVIALTSIPLFILSQKNKKLAKNYYAVSFKMEKNNSFPITGIGNKKFPAVKIGLRF